MTPLPKGYVALTASHDGSPFLLDARGLVVCPAKQMHRAGSKLPDACIVGPVTDTESYWTVAETFDEVCAKLVAALGAQECDTAAKVVEAAVAEYVNDDVDETLASQVRRDLWKAVKAHLAAEGRAK